MMENRRFQRRLIRAGATAMAGAVNAESRFSVLIQPGPIHSFADFVRISGEASAATADSSHPLSHVCFRSGP